MRISMMWPLFFFLSCSNKSTTPEIARTTSNASTMIPAASLTTPTIAKTETVSSLPPHVTGTISTSRTDATSTTSAINNTAAETGSVFFSVITSKNDMLPALTSDPKAQLRQLDNRENITNLQSNIAISYIGLHLDNFRFSTVLDDFASLEKKYTQQDMTNWKTDFSTVLQGLSWSPYISPRALMLDFLAGKKNSYLQNGSFPIALWSAVSQTGWTTASDSSEKKIIQDFFTTEFIPRCRPGASVSSWQDFYGKQSLSRSTQTDSRVQPIYSVLEPLTDPFGQNLPAIHVTEGTYQSIGFTIGMAWENERSQAFCRSFVIMGTYSNGSISIPFAVESYSPVYGQIGMPTAGIQVDPATSQYDYLRMDPSTWFSQVDWGNIEITMNGSEPLFAIFSEFSNSTEFYKIKNAISTSLSYTGISSPTNLFQPTEPAYTGTDISTTSRDFLTGYDRTSTDAYTTANSLGISFLDATGTATGSLWVDYRNQNALMYSNQRVSRFWLKKVTDGKGGANLLMRPDRWASTPLTLVQDSSGNLTFSTSAGTGQTLVRVGVHMEATGSTGYLENLDTGAFLQPYSPTTTETFPFVSTVTPAVKVITKSTTLQPVQFSYTATPVLMEITGITLDIASGFGLPGVGCSNNFSLYLGYQNCKNNTSASLPNPSSCPDALYSCPIPTPWVLFSVKNATTKPIFFSMAPLGATNFGTDIFLNGKFTVGGYSESVLIQPDATWSGNTSITGYPFADALTSVQFFVNDVPTGFYFTTGFKGASPTLTISLDASSNLTMTSSSTSLLKTLPAATAQ